MHSRYIRGSAVRYCDIGDTGVVFVPHDVYIEMRGLDVDDASWRTEVDLLVVEATKNDQPVARYTAGPVVDADRVALGMKEFLFFVSEKNPAAITRKNDQLVIRGIKVRKEEALR